MQSPTLLPPFLFSYFFFFKPFGLYEFITLAVLGSIKLEGSKGDFLNGVLATILSHVLCSSRHCPSICFYIRAIIILLIFIFVGLGLSSPFLLTAIFPAAIKAFKTGNWMNHFKVSRNLITFDRLLACFNFCN